MFKLLILIALFSHSAFAEEKIASDVPLSPEELEKLDAMPRADEFSICNVVLPNGETNCEFTVRLHKEHPESITQQELDECAHCKKDAQ